MRNNVVMLQTSFACLKHWEQHKVSSYRQSLLVNPSLQKKADPLQYALELAEAKNIHKNLKAGDKVIFIEDSSENYGVRGLLAEVIEKTGTQLTLCPVFKDLKTKITKQITVQASKCLSIYYANAPILGPDARSRFFSDKPSKFFHQIIYWILWTYDQSTFPRD